MEKDFVVDCADVAGVSNQTSENGSSVVCSFNHGDDLDRIVFSDRGSFEDGNGKVYHKVVMAFACDMKKIGDNIPVTNPYLVNRKSASGFVDHYIRLNDVLYHRLLKHSNKTGLEDTGWTGVIEGRVKVRDDCTTVLDLSDYGELVKPSVPFNFAKHISFIEASVTGVGFVKPRWFHKRKTYFKEDNGTAEMVYECFDNNEIDQLDISAKE